MRLSEWVTAGVGVTAAAKPEDAFFSSVVVIIQKGSRFFRK